MTGVQTCALPILDLDLLLEIEHQSELEDLEERALDDVGLPDEDDLEEE